MSIKTKVQALGPGADLWAFVEREEKSRPLKVGDTAPSFELTAMDGSRISSQDLLHEGSLVLTFYRGLWCPHCLVDLEEMQQALPAIKAAEAKVAAVLGGVADVPKDAVGDANVSGYPVLEDLSGEAAVRFGIRWHPDDAREINDILGNTLTAFRGTEPWIVPMQARFVITSSGVIRFADIVYDYNLRTGPDAFMDKLGLD